MIVYKLIRKRKDGSFGPLFINRKQVLPIGKWLVAENHPTKGYANRPGWHCCNKPEAPHLSMNGRRWLKVEIKDYYEFKRPKTQGGVWFIAKQMKIIEEV
jgi:hypothetical protein